MAHIERAILRLMLAFPKTADDDRYLVIGHDA